MSSETEVGSLTRVGVQFWRDAEVLRRGHNLRLQGVEIPPTDEAGDFGVVSEPLLDVVNAAGSRGESSAQLTFSGFLGRLHPIERISVAVDAGGEMPIYGLHIAPRDLQAIIGSVPLGQFVDRHVVPKIGQRMIAYGGRRLAPVSSRQLYEDLRYFKDLKTNRGYDAARRYGRPVWRASGAGVLSYPDKIARYPELPETLLDLFRPGAFLDVLTTGLSSDDAEKVVLQTALMDHLSPNSRTHRTRSMRAFDSVLRYVSINYDNFKMLKEREAENPLGVRLMSGIFGKPPLSDGAAPAGTALGFMRRELGRHYSPGTFYPAFVKEFQDFVDWHERLPRPEVMNPLDANSRNWPDFAACKGRSDVMDYRYLKGYKPDGNEIFATNHRKKNHAIAICNTSCPAVEACFRHGIFNGGGGLVWGGHSQGQLSRTRNALGIVVESDDGQEAEDEDN